MNKSMIVTLAGTVIVLAFLIAACGKSEQTETAPATEVKIGQAGMEEKHDHSGHDHAGHDHAGHAHGHDHSAKAKKAPQAAIKNGFDGMPAPGTPAHCPVMKNDFKVAADSESSVYKGKTYVFCCPGCKPQFEKDPEKYI